MSTVTRRRPAVRSQQVLDRIALHAALLAGAALVLVPFVLMVTTSFKPEQAVFSDGLLPTSATLDNYRFVLDSVPAGRYVLNSLVVTGVIVTAQLIVCVPAGYALARLRFRGARALLWMVLACLMIPAQAIAIPVYVMLNTVDLIDTRAGLIVPFLSSAFGIFLLRQFFLRVPEEIFDAARIDGVGGFSMVWRIAVPLARPAIAAFTAFSIVSHWNDFFWAFLILRTGEAATVPFAIAAFSFEEAGTLYGAQMAAATMAIVPLLLLFLCVQHHFAHGIAVGGD